MQDIMLANASRSTADVVFDRLYEDILSLAILPGSKISEAEVARRFGLSRQPVRDAFRRLSNLNLLEIRPQRATLVRRFSLAEIANTRFVRLSIELEVIERACDIWDQSCTEKLDECLAEQAELLKTGDINQFHEHDYRFHELICHLADLPMAFETINRCKRDVDRLCLFGLTSETRGEEVLEDHRAIADTLARRSVQDARAITRLHLGRLDKTITDIHATHTDYFQ